jgi:carbamate kinase
MQYKNKSKLIGREIMKKKIVIALGGNALGNNLEEQMGAVKSTARAIVD